MLRPVMIMITMMVCDGLYSHMDQPNVPSM